MYDFTVEFLKRYLKDFGNLRTRQQMKQVARSGKQNIVEEASQGTSLKACIKLTGVARDSLEVLEDCPDFARDRQIDVREKGYRRGGE